MKYCLHCGMKLRDESKFCYRCGNPCAPPREEVPDYLGADDEFDEDDDLLEEDELYGEDELMPEDELLSGEEEILADDDGEAYDEGADSYDEEEVYDEEASSYDEEASSHEDETTNDEEAVPEELTGRSGHHKGRRKGWGYARGSADADGREEDHPEEEEVSPRKRFLEALSDESYEDGDDEEYEDEDADYDRRRRRRKNSYSVAGPVIGIIIIGLIMAYLYWSPARKVYTMAYTGDTAGAEQLYKSSVRGLPTERLVLRLLTPAGIGHAFNAYNKGAISYDDARGRIETFSDIGGSGTGALLKLNQLSTLRSSKEAYAKAAEAETAGDLAEAVKLYSSVVREDVNFENARERMDAALDRYKASVKENLSSLVSDEDYRSAISRLEEGTALIKDDKELADLLTTTRQRYASELKRRNYPTAQDYIEAGHYAEAIGLLNAALEYNSEDSELVSLRNTAVTKYEDFVREQVDIYLGNNDKAGAVALLERAMRDLPDDALFPELYSTVRQSGTRP